MEEGDQFDLLQKESGMNNCSLNIAITIVAWSRLYFFVSAHAFVLYKNDTFKEYNIYARLFYF